MDDSFVAYIQRIEVLAFFSGYPLLYAAITFMAGFRPANRFWKKLVFLLPFSYALAGTLYQGLRLKNFAMETIQQNLTQSLLNSWALLALLFWIPALAKKNWLSLLHSAVFFFFILKDIFLQLFRQGDQDMVRNDMRIYTISLLLNMGCLLAVLLIYFLVIKIKNHNNTSRLY
jgi:hypothetical protein